MSFKRNAIPVLKALVNFYMVFLGVVYGLEAEVELKLESGQRAHSKDSSKILYLYPLKTLSFKQWLLFISTTNLLKLFSAPYHSALTPSPYWILFISFSDFFCRDIDPTSHSPCVTVCYSDLMKTWQKSSEDFKREEVEEGAKNTL